MGLLDILNGIQNSSGAPPAGSAAKGGGMSPIMMALLGLLAYKAFAGGGAKPAPSGGAAPGSLPTGGAGNTGGSLGDILGGVLGGRPGAAPGGSGGGSLGDILGGVLGGRSGGAPAGGGSLGDILGGMLGGKPGGAATGGGAGAGQPGGSLGDILGGLLGGKAGGAQGGAVLSDALSNIVRDLQKSGHGAAVQSWVSTGPNQALDPKDLGAALGPDVVAELSQHVGIDQQDLLAGLSHQLPQLIDQLTPDGRLPTPQEASRMV